MKARLNIWLAIILLSSLFLWGCASETAVPKDVEADSAKESFITVVDCFNREVSIAVPVERIACGYAYTGHVAALLGRGDDIVAVVDGLKRDKVLTEMYPHIKDLPVPFSTGAINIEELLSCSPDVVFIKTDTALNKDATDKLDSLNIPYVVIDYFSMEEQMKTISIMGKVLGEEEKAQSYINYYMETIEKTRKITSAIPQDERVSLYHSVNEAVRTDLKDSFQDQWIQVTGGINVSVNDELKVSGDKTYATLEQIYLWDPDIIIANESGVPEYILTNEQWASLRAVKEKKVYQIPNGISRWGHPGSLETPLAILWTSRLLYPQYFTDLDMVKETKNYYSRFFSMDLTEVQAQQILTGQDMRELKTN
ncbi:MAG: ABC transporter substrate-binding protein [Sedimentibacter sp.]|uniref:ABC transporter substrate-binding protein n=1 Tax=Sedimentibacter sp. TaxID=1960295 RepID=UPI003158CE38